jgi:anti-sigma factor RsiW
MTCRELIGFLDDYVAGGLDPGERRTFEEHLTECPDCVAYVRSYRDTIRLTKDALAETDAGALDVPAELLAAIVASRKRH